MRTLNVSWVRFLVLSASVLGVVAGAVGCESDEETASGPGAAGQHSAGAGGDGQGEGGSAGEPGAGGTQNRAGAGADAGGSGAGAAGETAAAGAGGGPSEGGDCFVELSMNTSNAIDVETPLSELCQAMTFDGQINFGVTNGADATARNINIDFFDEAVAGKSVKLEDGYGKGMGAAASYGDSTGVWNADSGTITIDSVKDDLYVVRLKNVHFAVIDGPFEEPNSGTFVANGTITAQAKPAM